MASLPIDFIRKSLDCLTGMSFNHSKLPSNETYSHFFRCLLNAHECFLLGGGRMISISASHGYQPECRFRAPIKAGLYSGMQLLMTGTDGSAGRNAIPAGLGREYIRSSRLTLFSVFRSGAGSRQTCFQSRTRPLPCPE